MMRKIWPKVELVRASTTMVLEESIDSIGDARMVIEMIMGALQRVLLFPSWELAIAQAVPAHVIAAYARLCSSGFAARLLTTEVATSPGT
jgi:hypothetical protein